MWIERLLTRGSLFQKDRPLGGLPQVQATNEAGHVREELRFRLRTVRQSYPTGRPSAAMGGSNVTLALKEATWDQVTG